MLILPSILIIIIVAILYMSYSDQKVNSNDTRQIAQPEKVIVGYKNQTYDITDFVKKHPGGKHVLLENNGKDVEQLMIENEHSSNAYKTLEKYIVK